MNFHMYEEKANIIINELAEELGFPEDKKRALRILRAVLKVLRARLTVQESIQFIAQLPMLLKAFYVEGWKYTDKPTRMKHIGEFVKAFVHEDQPVAHHDIKTAKDGENAIRAVLKVLRNHVSEGEVSDIIKTMPADLKPLWGVQSLV